MICCQFRQICVLFLFSYEFLDSISLSSLYCSIYKQTNKHTNKISLPDKSIFFLFPVNFLPNEFHYPVFNSHFSPSFSPSVLHFYFLEGGDCNRRNSSTYLPHIAVFLPQRPSEMIPISP